MKTKYKMSVRWCRGFRIIDLQCPESCDYKNKEVNVTYKIYGHGEDNWHELLNGE